jgi:UDP-2,3-diacylglucosamine pyrophosphatase LpxH
MNGRLDKNLLVISDLHLGEDLKPNMTSVSYLRRLARLEKELGAFLDYYAEHRIGGRPWRLVVNGDMVDFMSIQIMPGESGCDADERAYGLNHAEPQSLAKLERVFARHEGVFRKLASFVAADNELVVVVGNHDVEFCFPSLQRRFCEALGQLGAPIERIRFCPWFYYEEEVVYVEHGHQYDEFCSFDYQLQPVEQRGSVALSIAHAGVRYFTNLVPEMDPHCAEGWGFLDYASWLRAQGARGVARIVLFYATLIRKMIELWALLTDRRADAERAQLHKERLRALAASYRMAVDKVEALDGLRRLPAMKSLHKILVTLFLDRILLGLVTAVGVGVALGAARGLWKAVAAAAVLGAAALANYGLSRLRFLDSAHLLRAAPEAIWKIVRAPFIVFGHSHHPERVALPSGATYFNTGAWAQPSEPSEGAFTHLIISGEERPEAELYQWRDGESAKFPKL